MTTTMDRPASEPAPEEPKKKRDRTHWLYILVIVAVIAGIIVGATVRVEPLQEWRCVYASFGSTREAFDAALRLAAVEPKPRLQVCMRCGHFMSCPATGARPHA